MIKKCPARVDCQGHWTAWSSCSVSCGGGLQNRIYVIDTPAANKGGECPVKNGQEEKQSCNSQACPVNCVGQWSGWGECSKSCGTGSMVRQYNHKHIT